MYTAFLILLTLLAEPIFYSILAIFDIKAESGLMQYEFILIFALSILLFIKLIINNEFSKRQVCIMIGCIIIGLLYGLTYLRNGTPPDLYLSHLYRWVAICLSTMIVGIDFSNRPCFDELRILLPFFIIPTTIIIVSVGLFGSPPDDEEITIHDDSGLIYQNISYYSAYLFGLSSYYVFCFKSNDKYYKRFYKIIYLLLPFQVITCLISGGRGGALVIAVQGIFLFMIFIRKSILYKITSIVIVVILLNYIVDNYLIQTVGYQRISNMFEYDNRSEVYSMAVETIKEYGYLGCGLGGVFYNVGIYSHNIILDLLLELGVIGVTLFIILLLYLLKTANTLRKISVSYNFIIVNLIYFLVKSTFSGYWFSNQYFWFVAVFLLSVDISDLLQRKSNQVMKFAQ